MRMQASDLPTMDFSSMLPDNIYQHLPAMVEVASWLLDHLRVGMDNYSHSRIQKAGCMAHIAS